MSIEISFEDNDYKFQVSGLPFYIESNKEYEPYGKEWRDYYESQSSELQAAADKIGDEAGDEGWFGFLKGCKWYQEHLNKTI